MGWAWVRYWGKWLFIVLTALTTTGSVTALAWVAHREPWAELLTNRMTAWDWAAALILAAVPWWTLLAVQIHRDLRRRARGGPQGVVRMPLSVSASSMSIRA